jgi:glycosyltransferase involved in cell wall biosynthesis
MKILFLGEPDSPNTISWVTGLRKQGCDVTLASVRTNGNEDALAVGNPALPPRIRILTGVSHLQKIIAEIKPDLLLAYRVTSYGYLAAKTGFHPLVIAAQNEQIVYLPKPTFLRRKFLEKCAKFAIKKADLMHAWADNIADGLVKFGAERDKILVLHRGIDMEIFKDCKKRKFDKNAPVFISTRSLAPEYRIEKVIQAFAETLDKLPGAVLKIVGSGSEEERLKQIAADCRIEKHVHFLGRVNHQKLVQELQESDIYISIIETEGMSSSLIESTACGLLPIVTDMPASKKIIEDGVNGFLIDDIEGGKLSDIMLNAVEKYREMEPELTKNSARIKKAFNRTENQKAFIEKYQELL